MSVERARWPNPLGASGDAPVPFEKGDRKIIYPLSQRGSRQRRGGIPPLDEKSLNPLFQRGSRERRGGIPSQQGRAGWAMLLALALVAILGVGLLYSGSRYLPGAWHIQWLQVDGPFKRVSAEQIRAAVAPHAEGGFFQVDPDRVQAAAERLPWVAHAVVRKRWPDTLHIRVLEHRPVARWGETALINEQGELFQVPEGGGIKGLPVLTGPPGRVSDVVRRNAELRELLVGTGLNLRALTLTERGTWRMTLDHGIHVSLGHGDITSRLRRFTAVFNDYFAPRARALISVDLRYTNGFAVQWRSFEESVGAPVRARTDSLGDAGSYGREEDQTTEPRT